MEKMNYLEMTDEALQSALIALYGKIEALPARFPVCGREFTWAAKTDYDFKRGADGNLESVWKPYLEITQTSSGDLHEARIDIHADGTVKYYSFWSASGRTNEEAAETLNYYQVCATLLSEDFRQAIIQDYTQKLATLTVLQEEYKAIDKEQDRRRYEAEDARKAKEAKDKEERRAILESVGQVWFDYSMGYGCRLVVKSKTEKTINFSVCFFENNEWKPATYDDTKRVSKHLLGEKPARYYRDNPRVMVCPVGTADLENQKYEQPETVAY